MITFFKKKLNPACYQGNNKLNQHFEGWYFKIIDEKELYSYVIIPGIFIDKNELGSHSFIQIFDGNSKKSFYFKFPIEDFSSNDLDFNIQINSNYFSSNHLILDLQNSLFKISGELNFTDLIKWPKSLIAPGIMGWYTWVPFMECYHGIISLNHKIKGSLSINDQNIDFSNGKGYTEKDWGRSFPEAWLWCQSNHFNTKNVSLTGSIAIIPWIRRPFLGFIFGLWYKEKLYRFTTWTGAKIYDLEINDSKISFVIKQEKLVLKLIINQMDGGFLQAPTINGMTRKISETLKSTLEITLLNSTILGDEILFSEIGRHAGFEIAGDVNRLLHMYKATI